MKLVCFRSLLLSLLLTVTSAFAAVPTVKFAAPVNYNSGGLGANFVVSQDVDGDGVPDLIVSNTNGVSVMINNGDGTFQDPVVYETGGLHAFAVAVADVNADGFSDLVVTNTCFSGSDDCSHGGIGVLLNNGDGTFQPPLSFDAGGAETSAIAIADINNDGTLDVVVTANCQLFTCVDGAIYLLLGKGDGTFKAPSVISASNGGPVAIADLNGDGILDLVASEGVLLGNGDGTFTQLGSNIAPNAVGFIPGGANSINIVDINGDGKWDVIVTDNTGVKTQLGNGDGTLQLPVAYKTGGAWALAAAVADVNGDGIVDLVVANECTTAVRGFCSGMGGIGVLLGNGDGTFRPAVKFASGGKFTVSVAAGDVDLDGRNDVVVTNACFSATDCTSGGVAVLINNFTAKVTIGVTTSLSPAFVNQPITFTATLTSSVPVPDGSEVDFTDGANFLGSGSTSHGVASLTVGIAKAGNHSIKATFSGDLIHTTAAGVVKQVVTLYSSTTTLESSPNPSDNRQPVTLTARVSSPAPGGPTGSVIFKDGTTTLGSAPLNGAGVAFLTTTKLPVGTSTVTATYHGDTQSATSSGTLTHTVNP